MLHERTAHILEATIREFIRTGEPVSSSWLFRRYQFGIKPAMIRHELTELTDKGYLEQPHHSAGRVPANRGYEFFAEQVLAETGNGVSDHELLDLFEEMAWQDFVGRFSEDLGILCVAASARGHFMCKEGLDALVTHLDWNSRSDVMSVIRDFEALDRRLENAETLFEGQDFIKVFVGRKSPVTRSQILSVFAADYPVRHDRVVILAIGPKRMDYESTARIFKGLKKIAPIRE